MVDRLSHVRRQAITWTNADLLSIGLLKANFSESHISQNAHVSYPKYTIQITDVHISVLNGVLWDM